MSSFHITVREHTYTGRFYTDIVEAESFEQALQLAAGRVTAPQPPPDSKHQSFNVTVTEPTYTGRFYTDIVEAESFEQALQLAAGRATAPQPPPGSEPRPDGADRRRCSDTFLYRLLHCELAEGHDPPHMAVAPGYWRPARWVRDERGLAHALPEPATGNREVEGREAQTEEPPTSRSSADTVAGSTGITVPLQSASAMNDDPYSPTPHL